MKPHTITTAYMIGTKAAVLQHLHCLTAASLVDQSVVYMYCQFFDSPYICSYIHAFTAKKAFDIKLGYMPEMLGIKLILSVKNSRYPY